MKGAFVLAEPSAPCAPAMTCANELSVVAGEFLNLERLDPARPHVPDSGEHVFVAALSFKQLAQLYQSVQAQLPKSAVIVGYVFDGYFSSKMHRAPRLARELASYLPRLRNFEAIYTPFKELVEAQAAEFDLPLKYLPIGVDALRFGAAYPVSQRSITVNAYGRQPAELVELLADRMNRDGTGLFSYTSHMAISELTDPVRHRDLFWNMLRHSSIALAYSPESCDPHGRFPCSFLGQRWYEGLAAGCAIAGKRPRAVEAEAQLDWPDATIELPDDPIAAAEAVIALSRDEARLDAIALTNATKALERHDWRLRLLDIPELAEIVGADLQDGLQAQIDAKIAALKTGHQK